MPEWVLWLQEVPFSAHSSTSESMPLGFLTALPQRDSALRPLKSQQVQLQKKLPYWKSLTAKSKTDEQVS
jgi:hypothetical protein